jgi:truncated hemoglobin YjbI
MARAAQEVATRTSRALLACAVVAVLSGCSKLQHGSQAPQSTAAAVEAQVLPVSTAATPPLNAVDHLLDATKPEFEAWFRCTAEAAIRYLDAKETADVVARASMTSCWARENALHQSVSVHNYTRLSTLQIMDIRRDKLRDQLVELVIRSRQNFAAAKTRHDAWAECLVNAATTLAAPGKTIEEIAKASFFTCREREESMRSQLATFLPTSAPSIINERRAKALPILTRYIEQIRSGGSRPAKPDIIT